MRKPNNIYSVSTGSSTEYGGGNDHNRSGGSSAANSRNNSHTNLNSATGPSEPFTTNSNSPDLNGNKFERGSPIPLPRKKSMSQSIQNLVNSIRAPNPAQLSQISRFRSGSQSSQPRSRSASLSVVNRPGSSCSRADIESVNPFHANLTAEMNQLSGLDRSYSPLQSQMHRHRSESGLNGVIEVDDIQAMDLNPFRMNNNDSNTGNDGSVVITNGDNSAHNTFNPAAYNYNMANITTVANLRDLIDGGENTPVNRTRGNTLRGEEQADGIIGSASMNAANSDSLGTNIMNPIRIDDSGDEQMLNDVIRGEMIGSAMFEPLHEVPEQENEVDLIDVDVRQDTPHSAENNDGGQSNNQIQTQSLSEGRSRIGETSDADADGFYAIRFTPAIDHSSIHPYMFFGPIIRKLKPGMSLIIGRYTEKSKKAATAAAGSSDPVVFKSKVVSRKHAELSVDDQGRWFIQDVGSSSGLFLNHVRLSMPNVASSKVTLREGDILQFGVDYRGGSEEMYRCVKVKVEVNESWKKRGAKFSKAAHEKLKQLTGMVGSSNNNNNEDGTKSEYTACVICLCDIKPGQPMFVASCSHVWHYRCIRPLLVKTYPQFLCPTCKGVCDLEAEIDD